MTLRQRRPERLPSAERIPFLPGLLPFTLRYTNRPTGIQQVIEFRPRDHFGGSEAA